MAEHVIVVDGRIVIPELYAAGAYDTPTEAKEEHSETIPAKEKRKRVAKVTAEE